MTPEEEAAIREREADADIRTFSPQASQAVIDRHVLLAELDATRADRDRLRTAALRVVEWADHHEPWNPSGDFDALARAALKGT